MGLFRNARRAARRAGHDWRSSYASNTVITGDTGSGKTTGAGAHALTNILTHPDRPSILFTCAKVSDAPRYRAYCEEYGRTDLKVITVGGPNGLDPVRTWLRHPAATYYNAERMLSQAVALADDGVTGSGDDPFWPRSASLVRTSAVTVIHCAYGQCDIRGIHAFIRDMPYGEEGKASETYREGFAYKAIQAAKARGAQLTDAQRRQLSDAVKYVNISFAGTEAKCRESVRLTALTGLDPFLAEPIGSLLDHDNISPEDLQSGTSILNAVGVIEHKAPGRLYACLLRMICDEWLVARDPRTAHPVVSWMDEAHLTLVGEDVRIATICRESKLYQYRLFQTLPTAYDAVKVQNPEHMVAALYANHPVKVFHNTLCQTTAKFASALCGEKFEAHYGGSGNLDRYDLWEDFNNTRESGISCSWSEHKVPAVHPSVLATLRRGGKADKYVADALIVEAGRPHRFQAFDQIFVGG